MIAELLRLVGEVIRVNADTVTTHQTGEEFQEVPFGSRRFQHRFGINSHLVKDDGKFVHEGNVDISLAVFNHLGRLRHFNGLGPVHAGLHHQLVDLRNSIQGFRVHAGNNFHNGFQTVNLIAGIDALRRVSDFKIHAAGKSRFLFQNRHADILRHAGINRGLENHHRALCKVLSQNPACALHRSKVRGMVAVYRRGDRHDMEFRFPKLCRVRSKFHAGISDGLVPHLLCGVNALLIQRNLLLV